MTGTSLEGHLGDAGNHSSSRLFPSLPRREEEAPKPILEYFEKGRKISGMVENARIMHNDAYSKGLETIKNKESGEFDLQKLDDEKVQDAFLDKMVEHYLGSIKERLGLDSIPEDEFEQDVLMQRHVGVTRGQLKQMLRNNKSNYTLKAHEGLRDHFVGQQEQQWNQLRYDHLEDAHIDDIIKYVGVKDYVERDNLGLQQVVPLLDRYQARGHTLGMTDLAQLVGTEPKKGGWGSNVYLNAEGKQELKQLTQSSN